MRRLIFICAPSDLTKAKAIARLVSAEDRVVQVVHRKIAIAPSDAETFGVVLWSRHSVESFPVRHFADELFNRRALVQIALEPAPVKADFLKPLAPIDFSRWTEGDRGSLCWQTLENRIERMEHGEDPAAAHFGGAVSVAAASLAIVALAVSNRVVEGPALQNLAPQLNVAEASQMLERPMVDVGGPQQLEAELTQQDQLRVRMVRVAPALRLSPAPPVTELASFGPIPGAPPLARPSLLRRVLDAAESLPLVGERRTPPNTV